MRAPARPVTNCARQGRRADRVNPGGTPPGCGAATRLADAQNASMRRRHEHTWGPERRRDGDSGWPSAGIVVARRRPGAGGKAARLLREHPAARYVGLAFPVLVMLALSAAGVLYLVGVRFHG
jgi:hypothetical protein